MADIQNIAPASKKFERAAAAVTATVAEKMQQAADTAVASAHDVKAEMAGGISQAADIARSYADVQRSTFESVVTASKIYGEGLKGLATHAAAVNRSQFEQTMAHFRALSGVKSLKEAFGLQAQFAREITSKALNETSALVEEYLKVTGDAIAPVTAQVRDAAEKVKLAA